ncbi:hypothetical protein ACIQZG_22520 [Lysinibacillus sp. NPDC096418]|uniref:hypothetical protein n=1 Tax=Lysinibacillus sp. NPDC096418 TaxID=3364138 RepID=UPI00380B63F6
MKAAKGLAIILAAVIGMTLFTGCSSRKDHINTMDMGEVERLPEAQKESELDKTLAEMRKYRTDNVKVGPGGVSTSLSMRDDAIPGQTKNRPEFIDLTTEAFWEFIHEYLKNEVKVPERKYGYDVAQCIDPRMNAIYDEGDKGVAAGYENENILLIEYETAEAGVYSYLVLVRESKESSWDIIHDGLSYKE